MPFFHNRCDTFFCRGICSSVLLHRLRKYRSPHLSGVRSIRISIYGGIGMWPVRSFYRTCSFVLLPVLYRKFQSERFADRYCRILRLYCGKCRDTFHFSVYGTRYWVQKVFRYGKRRAPSRLWWWSARTRRGHIAKICIGQYRLFRHLQRFCGQLLCIRKVCPPPQ